MATSVAFGGLPLPKLAFFDYIPRLLMALQSKCGLLSEEETPTLFALQRALLMVESRDSGSNILVHIDAPEEYGLRALIDFELKGPVYSTLSRIGDSYLLLKVACMGLARAAISAGTYC